MTKRTTKRALLLSCLSLLLCVSMLVGTTFAWFTDSASTGVNTIQSGNLDVGLKYSTDFSDWKDAEAATEIFDKDALWEPGYTEVVYFEVENKGSLAFNYRVGTNLVNNVIGKTQDDKDIDLTKYIKFGIVKVDKAFANRDAALAAVEDSAIDFANLFVAEDSLATKGATQRFAMVVFMPTTVNNEANHNGTDIPSIEFGVQVIATQKAEESDSFDKQYDKDATYPQFAFVEYEADKELVIKGEGFEAIIPANAGLETSDDHQDVADNTEIVMKKEVAASAPNITVEVGDIVLPYLISLETKDGEAVETTEKPITVKLDIGAGRGAVVLYHYTEKVEGAAYDSTTGILTFTTKDFSPFTVVEKAAITADTSWYNETDTEFVLKDAADLFGLAKLVNDKTDSFKGKTVKLGADIDLENSVWAPIGANAINSDGTQTNPKNQSYFEGTFDGQNYNISNINVTQENTMLWKNCRGLFGQAADAIFKNIAITNAKVKGEQSSAVLVGYGTGVLAFENIEIYGTVQVDVSMSRAACILGYGSISSISEITIDVTEDSYIRSNRPNSNNWEYIGGVWGHSWPATATNVTSNIDVYAYASATGGIGGGCAIKSENINCTGNVTMSIKDSEIHKGTIQCWQTNGSIYGFGVGSGNSSTQQNCVSTGTLTVAGNTITDNALKDVATGYESNDVRFGAPYYAAGIITIVD